MSVFSQFFNLDKYEGSDRPNLRDQYNSAIDKIDSILHSQAGSIASSQTSISTLQSTVSQQGVAIAQATTDASDAKAQATAAVAAMGGSTLEFISNGDRGSKWSAIGDSYVAGSSVRFDGVIVTDAASGESLLIAHVGCTWSSDATVHASGHQVLSLRDWRLVHTGEDDTFEAWSYFDAAVDARFIYQGAPAAPYVITLNSIHEISGTRRFGLSGTIICQVSRRV